MDDYALQQKPSKLVPVLIGGAVMAATAVIPVLNMINCLCCAGIMGGGVLAVYFYKKNFSPDLPFSVGDGTIAGLFSGLVGAVLTAIIQAMMIGVSTHGLPPEFDEGFDNAIRQMEGSGQDPQIVYQMKDFITQVATSPFLLFLLILIFSLFIFAAFGTLGGVIGGNIFKTRVVKTSPPSQQIGSSS